MAPQPLKLLTDECLSPSLAGHLNQEQHDAVHARDRGWRGVGDHVILRHALAEDRVIVTANAVDFRSLVGREELHPGLITLPNRGREATWRLLRVALAYLEVKGDASRYMVNRVLEVSSGGAIEDSELP